LSAIEERVAAAKSFLPSGSVGSYFQQALSKAACLSMADIRGWGIKNFKARQSTSLSKKVR